MKKLRSFVLLCFSCGYSYMSTAQEQLPAKVASDLCQCYSATPDTSSKIYARCLADAFAKYKNDIQKAYKLTATSTYDESKRAGADFQKKVAVFLQKDCTKYRRYIRR